MVPLILGAIASAYADADAQKRRQALLNGMRSYQLGQSAVGQKATQDYLTGATPEARAAEIAKLTGDRTKTLQDSVAAVQASNPTPLAGKLSPDYARSQAAAAGTVADRTKRAIEQLSTMGMPGEAGVQGGIRFGRAAGVVDATNSAINRVGDTYTRGIDSTVPDPMLKLGGNALMAYGSSGAGNSSVNNGQGYEDASGNLYSPNVTRQQRLSRAFSLWGR